MAPLSSLVSVVDEVKSINQDFTFSAATNLVYKLTDDIRYFIKTKLDNGISTSWDPSIRFANEKQEQLWLKNLKTLINDGINITLNISLSFETLKLDIESLLIWVRSLGVSELALERITEHGNAVQSNNSIPSNLEIDKWYVDLYETTQRLGARDWFYNSLLEDVLIKFEKNITNSGTFYRACEERLFTVNSDGTVSGCPNEAPTNKYGHIDQQIQELFDSPQRIKTIVKEKIRNEQCFNCDVFGYCGSGCYQLKWEGAVCPSPKSLMRKLAKLPPLEDQKSLKSKIIPIYEVNKS